MCKYVKECWKYVRSECSRVFYRSAVVCSYITLGEYHDDPSAKTSLSVFVDSVRGFVVFLLIVLQSLLFAFNFFISESSQSHVQDWAEVKSVQLLINQVRSDALLHWSHPSERRLLYPPDMNRWLQISHKVERLDLCWVIKWCSNELPVGVQTVRGFWFLECRDKVLSCSYWIHQWAADGWTVSVSQNLLASKKKRVDCHVIVWRSELCIKIQTVVWREDEKWKAETLHPFSRSTTQERQKHSPR